MVKEMTKIDDTIKDAAEGMSRSLFGETVRWLYAAGCDDIPGTTGRLWVGCGMVRTAVSCIRIECTGQHMLLVAG